jgi:hypothetical protein
LPALIDLRARGCEEPAGRLETKQMHTVHFLLVGVFVLSL